MAKHKKTHSKKSFTLPVAVVAGLAPGVVTIAKTYQAGGLQAASQAATMIYTGYDYNTGKFNAMMLGRGLMPTIAGIVAHKVAGMLGINRAIAAAGIPVFRI